MRLPGSSPGHLLARIGRHGGTAVLALIAAGVALPAVDRWLLPFVTPAVFVLLAVSVLRTDLARVAALVQRPGLVLAAVAWSTLALPLALGLAGQALGIAQRWPQTYLGLVLQGAAPPMMSAPAFTALLGLDADLVLVCMLGCMAVTPLTSPLLVHLFLAGSLAVRPGELGWHLASLTAGAVATAGPFSGPRRPASTPPGSGGRWAS